MLVLHFCGLYGLPFGWGPPHAVQGHTVVAFIVLTEIRHGRHRKHHHARNFIFKSILQKIIGLGHELVCISADIAGNSELPPENCRRDILIGFAVSQDQNIMVRYFLIIFSCEIPFHDHSHILGDQKPLDSPEDQKGDGCGQKNKKRIYFFPFHALPPKNDYR